MFRSYTWSLVICAELPTLPMKSARYSELSARPHGVRCTAESCFIRRTMYLNEAIGLEASFYVELT